MPRNNDFYLLPNNYQESKNTSSAQVAQTDQIIYCMTIFKVLDINIR